MQGSDIRAKMSSQGVEAVGSAPQQYSSHLKEELAKYGRIVKAAGIRIE